MRYLWILIGCFLLTISLAAQDVSACDTINPPDAGALFYVGLGDSYSRRGQYADALNAYDCSIERNPNFAEAFVSRGIAHASQLNSTQAFRDYNQALELDSMLLSAYNNRGLLYSLDANYSLALADFNLLIQLEPDYIQAYHNRAMVHAAEGNFDLAMADLQEAIALNPDYAPSHQALGAVYLALATQSYITAEAINGRPVQYDVPDTLVAVLRSEQEHNPGVWFSLQTLDQVFEDEP